MKKLAYFSMALLVLAFAACTKNGDTNTPGNNDRPSDQPSDQPSDNPSDTPSETVSIVGTWLGVFESETETNTFNADKTYSALSEMTQVYGTYTNDDKTITTTVTKHLQRDWQRDPVSGGPIQDKNGNYLYTEWEEKELTDEEKQPSTIAYKLTHKGDALLISTGIDEEGDGRQASISPYVPYLRSDATTLSDINEIQGKWYWMSHFGDQAMPRTVLIINGDQAEYIITPWGERYTGKVTYEKGILTMANPTYATTRWDDPEGDYEHMNEEHPEDSQWKVPDGDPSDWWGAFVGGVRIALVLADDGQLYSIAANLPCNYTKQQ